MFELIIISIGLVLVVEGVVYFLVADKIVNILSIIKNTDPKKIKTFSILITLIGLCLIYFTFRFYKI